MFTRLHHKKKPGTRGRAMQGYDVAIAKIELEIAAVLNGNDHLIASTVCPQSLRLREIPPLARQVLTTN